jgi:hypothetical protein
MVLPYDNMDYGVDEVGARNITELTDVELTNLANGEILKYNSTNLKWENQPDSAGGGSLDNLTDTNISSLLNGQFLQYNSSNSKWENSTFIFTDTDNLVDLTDTNISSVANNEILKYNSSSGNWENNNLLINEIQDINITSLQNGEVLKYNSTSGKWENQDNTDTLNELTDVTLTGSTNNQVLKYNGSIWVNNFVNLTELADTNIPTLNNGDILRYNSTSTKWETGTFNINDLDNVNITSVANNEILKYNSTTSKWENSNRIDTLDELGDVTLTTVATGDLLRYNGSNFVNTKIDLDNDFTNVNFTSLTNGDLIKYDGSNFINFAPTYLDSTSPANGITTIKINNWDTAYSWGDHAGQGYLTSLPQSLGTSDSPSFTQLSLGTTGTNQGILNLKDLTNIGTEDVAQIKGIKEGTNGGQLQFYTKADSGGALAERLRIREDGHARFFNNLTTDEILGTVSNVAIYLDQTRGSFSRIYFDTGRVGNNFEFYVDELNAYYNGSPTGLYLNYNGSGVFYGNPATQLSDDRIKFNETNITNGLEVVRKLSPERYTKRLPTQTEGAVEAGFIAQEVLSIPDLEFAVKQSNKEIIPGDPNTNYYTVTYDSIFTYAVAGLKELDVIVQQQQTVIQQQQVVIQNLVTRIEALESK